MRIRDWSSDVCSSDLLASIGGEIQFALLSDWPDAASETVEGDEKLLQTAVEAIARLNCRHAPAPGGDRFLLLHRRRVWNESQRLWVGWERKRGKLHELNRSEEHTSELQSLMRISYAVFCLKKKILIIDTIVRTLEPRSVFSDAYVPRQHPQSQL